MPAALTPVHEALVLPIALARWAAGPVSDRGLPLPGESSRSSPPTGWIARAAILAAFVALLVHTLAYAGFFEDPITWVLLSVGSSLAWAETPEVRDPA